MAALRVASDYTQLALHALAHLPIPSPGRLDDPRYLAWSAREVPREARAILGEDAPRVAALFVRERCEALHAIPELFADIARFRASASRELSELRDDEVASPALLAAVRGSAAAELLRSAMLLSAPAFERFFEAELAARCERGRERLEPVLAQARACHSALAGSDVEIAWPLGERGRAFSKRIVVGVPGDFAALTPAHAAVIAMHEASVRAAHADYARAEWTALVELAGSIASAPRMLRDAHASWLASLDLGALCEEAASSGLVSIERARAIAQHPDRRVAELASLAN